MARIKDKDLLAELHRGKHHCALCGVSRARSAWPHLQLHHIYGGANRHDVRTNLIMLCSRCHDQFHAGKISRASILNVKAIREPKEWDPAQLAELIRPRILPELEPIPEWAELLYRDNRPRDKAHFQTWAEPNNEQSA
jgi:5-methylcytosine-specific restriction endonuclease McrA